MISESDGSNAPAGPSSKPRIGVSACLAGEPVRYDGAHKRDDYVANTLAALFDLVPICPEVGIGMPVPRPPIHLVKTDLGIRALGVDDPTLDMTDALNDYYEEILPLLHGISGYILKSESPSCGMAHVGLYDWQGDSLNAFATGIFAARLMAIRPLLPVEDEERLNKPDLRENFINRVFVYQRWQELVTGRASRDDLKLFHADHSDLLMAHDKAGYRRLSRIVAEAGKAPLVAALGDYAQELMGTLRRKAAR